uniref:Uncharacterized protein n=1 Tax=Aegilops tauschii subsp. strangulata TaxID=200361 RepID=A0A453KSG0_AEGTS
EEQYSYEDIQNCMKKVIPLDLKQTIQVDRELVIRAYYAGHVCSHTYVSLASSNILKLLFKVVNCSLCLLILRELSVHVCAS